jgi:uncharacterized iron-regulated membrane protein
MTIAPPGRRFTSWIRRIHIYAGLLNFSMLMVFGLAGLVVTFKAPDIMHSGIQPDTRTVAFTAPESLSDKQVGERIASVAGRPPRAGEHYIHRDDSNRLLVDWYTANGLVRAVYLEQEHRLEIQTWRNSIWRFFDNVHATTIADRSPDPVVRAWTWYIELSIWSLIGMCLSGIWLGVASRWRFTWARIALGAGCAVFAVFFLLER